MGHFDIREVPGLLGIYADTQGHIYKVYPYGLQLKWGNMNTNGYFTYRFNGSFYYGHRLVAKTFLPNWSDDLEVNHIDGNPSNNSLLNLEMSTHKENILHAIKIGLMNNSGASNKMSKLKEQDVIFIKENLNKYKQKDLALMFSIHPSVISDIKRRKLWRHV